MFFPISSIWAHKTLELALHKALVNLGHEVISVYCDEALSPSCPAFIEAGLKPRNLIDKETLKICSICKSRSRVADTITHTSEKQRLQLRKEASAGKGDLRNRVEESNPNLWDMEKRESLYEVLVNSKATSLDLTEEHLGLVSSSRANWLKTREMARTAITENKPDLFLTGDPLYSMNAGVWAACRESGVRVAAIGSALNHLHSGNAFSLFSSIEDQSLIAWSIEWERASTRRLTHREIRNIAKSIRYSLTGKSPFVYSSGHKSMRKSQVLSALGLTGEKPIVLVITTTNDERFAAKAVGKLPLMLGPRNFSSQLDFLEEVKALADRRSDLNFVVRLHPRLLPNKRDDVQSPYLTDIQVLLASLPYNVVVNSPDQNLSLWDVALASDSALNWTSTAGLDVLTLGVPVVSCEPLETYSYPPSLGLKLVKRTDLESVMMSALGEGRSLRFAVGAFRYKNYLSKGLTAGISSLARKRSRMSLFRMLNWARLRGKVLVPSWLGMLVDFLDGVFFTVKRSDLERLDEFLSKSLSHLPPPKDFLRDGSSEGAELRGIRNALRGAIGKKLDFDTQ